ncbi:ThuA domain-containing protein [Thermotoga sp.]|uniref:ThuA domain-containing protein n=1 Tax=Thermotoga sp. TaxID=28240 RepID=UPI0025CCC59D|nr:ThuA domain-containing protein [Thermotoga sp.]MCD6552051.1 ThuA domain-containing protein [Thermotoga sp.]
MRVFAFLGDRYHDHDLFLETLKDALNGEIHDLRPEEFSEIRKLPDLVVIGRWNLIDDEKLWLDEESVRFLEEYVKTGGKLFVWHSGLARFPESYNRLVGGRFIHHPPQKKVRYYGKNVEFELIDEHYFVELYSDVEIFFWSESEDGISSAGWVKRFHKGKILALTPAHSEGLKDEAFRNFLRNALSSFIVQTS